MQDADIRTPEDRGSRISSVKPYGHSTPTYNRRRRSRMVHFWEWNPHAMTCTQKWEDDEPVVMSMQGSAILRFLCKEIRYERSEGAPREVS
jgi:hypothetical protein